MAYHASADGGACTVFRRANDSTGDVLAGTPGDAGFFQDECLSAVDRECLHRDDGFVAFGLRLIHVREADHVV
jgi:hypothetical protein